MPEAVLYTTGKPDNAGGPQPRFYVDMEGGLGRRPYCVLWEARQSGRPGEKKNTLRYTEAGLCRRPHCMPDNAGGPQPRST